MATLPTPLKAALGLAATALDEARKLPETLPQAPVVVVSTAMQVSLRVQQRIAALAARGDEVISQLRGSSSEPPDWATFDESPEQTTAGGGRGIAAFDRVPEGSAGDPGDAEVGPSLTGVPDRFEPAEVGGTEPDGSGPGGSGPGVTDGTEPGDGAPGSPANGAKRSTKKTAGAGKAAATKPAGPAKTGPAKTGPAKAGPVKAAKAAKAGGTKASAARPAKPASTRSEPLTEAAKRAKPAAAPNPVTMAAEIVHAHEIAGQDGTGPAQLPGAGSGSE
jgi:hypothetical protein